MQRCISMVGSSLSNMFWLHTDVNKYHGRLDQGFDNNDNSD